MRSDERSNISILSICIDFYNSNIYKSTCGMREGNDRGKKGMAGRVSEQFE